MQESELVERHKQELEKLSLESKYVEELLCVNFRCLSLRYGESKLSFYIPDCRDQLYAILSGNQKKLSGRSEDFCIYFGCVVKLPHPYYSKLIERPGKQFVDFSRHIICPSKHKVDTNIDGILPGLMGSIVSTYTSDDKCLVPGMAMIKDQTLAFYISGYTQEGYRWDQTPQSTNSFQSNVVSKFIQADCKYFHIDIKNLFSAQDSNGNTALFFPFLTIVLDGSENLGRISTVAKKYRNCIHYLRTLGIISELIMLGCDVNHCNIFEMSPLVYWVYQCVPLKYIEFLIKCGASLSCPFLDTSKIDLITILKISPFKNENYPELLEFLSSRYKMKSIEPIVLFQSIFYHNISYNASIKDLENVKTGFSIHAADCYAAFFQGSGSNLKGNDLARLRFLTGAHGLRPIRNRLVRYLVSNEWKKREIVEIDYHIKFKHCLIELIKRYNYGYKYTAEGFIEWYERGGPDMSRRINLRFGIICAHYIYENYDRGFGMISKYKTKEFKGFPFIYSHITPYLDKLYDEGGLKYTDESSRKKGFRKISRKREWEVINTEIDLKKYF